MKKCLRFCEAKPIPIIIIVKGGQPSESYLIWKSFSELATFPDALSLQTD